MANMNQVGTHQTTVRGDNGAISVVYWYTEVVKVTPCNIVLNTGGWETVTTKTRMNQASNQFGLGFNVYQKNWNWFVEYKGKTHEFKGDSITLKR